MRNISAPAEARAVKMEDCGNWDKTNCELGYTPVRVINVKLTEMFQGEKSLLT